MPSIAFDGYRINDKNLLTAGEEELRQRQKEIEVYWKYYAGDHPKHLKPEPGKHDDNVVLNLCGQAVDKLVAFLFADVPILQYDTKSMTNDANEIWEEAYIESFLTDLALSGVISGHVFVRLANNPDAKAFTLIDPQTIVAFWDKRVPDRLLWYRMMWGDTYNIHYIQDIIPAKVLDDNPEANGWYIIDYEGRPPNGYREVRREFWDANIPPIVDWKNGPLPFSLLRYV
jgi:hypothetical protein